MLEALSEYPEFSVREKSMCLRYGTDALTRDGGFDPWEIVREEAPGIEKFRRECGQFLLYRDI